MKANINDDVGTLPVPWLVTNQIIKLQYKVLRSQGVTRAQFRKSFVIKFALPKGHFTGLLCGVGAVASHKNHMESPSSTSEPSFSALPVLAPVARVLQLRIRVLGLIVILVYVQQHEGAPTIHIQKQREDSSDRILGISITRPLFFSVQRSALSRCPAFNALHIYYSIRHW